MIALMIFLHNLREIQDKDLPAESLNNNKKMSCSSFATAHSVYFATNLGWTKNSADWTN